MDKEYRIWYWMKTACYNQKSKAYRNYGENGVTVCDEWLSYENFLRDMGYCPPECTGIELKQPNKVFCKENCKWVGTHNRQRMPYRLLNPRKPRTKKIQNPRCINVRMEKQQLDYIVRQSIERSRREGKKVTTSEMIREALENQFPYNKQKELF